MTKRRYKMQIPVNTNIDNYKDDFFKGFSAKETAYAGVILLIYLLAFTVAASWFIYKKKNL